VFEIDLSTKQVLLPLMGQYLWQKQGGGSLCGRLL